MTEKGHARRMHTWMAVVVLVACARAFTAPCGVEIHAHGVGGHTDVEPGFVLNVGADSDRTSDPTQLHFHCTGSCVHAPLVAPTHALSMPAATAVFVAFEPTLIARSPVFAHFRPPRV